MEKLNTIQKRNNLNEVYRNDEPGAGGACHVYVICHRVFPVGEKERVVPIAEIVFQHGPRIEEKVAALESTIEPDELKPCPFCGAPAQRKELNGRYAVECTKKCVGTRIFADKDRATEAWNRRV